ncbi:hypothetical protein AMATHDRAFT_50101 [Amanita thiersii Skay4041]|uniref:Uncharacterized protein n=1 Tax=Amanita thiersii Skay4041 TaxID=703135 RepID=A0A2A9NHG7_9AGAR|nr:hypothetical protein AMATHDRAFT_50101 [Amanita thiersii Skay4041]
MAPADTPLPIADTINDDTPIIPTFPTEDAPSTAPTAPAFPSSSSTSTPLTPLNTPSPTTSLPPIPSSTGSVIFYFNSVPQLYTCQQASISWHYFGPDDTLLSLAITNAGVDQNISPPLASSSSSRPLPTFTDNQQSSPPFNQPPDYASSQTHPPITVPIRDTLDPQISTYTWAAVSVPEGWYVFQANLTSGTNNPRSTQFFVHTGDNTSCLSSTIPPTTTGGTGNATSVPGNNVSDSGSSGSHVNAGAIAGGIVGGAAFIFLLTILFLFYTRFRKKKQAQTIRGDVPPGDEAKYFKSAGVRGHKHKSLFTPNKGWDGLASIDSHAGLSLAIGEARPERHRSALSGMTNYTAQDSFDGSLPAVPPAAASATSPVEEKHASSPTSSTRSCRSYKSPFDDGLPTRDSPDDYAKEGEMNVLSRLPNSSLSRLPYEHLPYESGRGVNLHQHHYDSTAVGVVADRSDGGGKQQGRQIQRRRLSSAPSPRDEVLPSPEPGSSTASTSPTLSSPLTSSSVPSNKSSQVLPTTTPGSSVAMRKTPKRKAVPVYDPSTDPELQDPTQLPTATSSRSPSYSPTTPYSAAAAAYAQGGYSSSQVNVVGGNENSGISLVEDDPFSRQPLSASMGSLVPSPIPQSGSGSWTGGHYLTRSQSRPVSERLFGMSGSASASNEQLDAPAVGAPGRELTHKNSFGFEPGRAMHYLIPDLPLEMRK